MTRRLFLAATVLTGLVTGILTGPAAQAAEPRLLGTFRDWNAFVLEEPSGRVCWMASRPRKDEGNYSRRGDIFALVTHRPGEKSTDVVSFVAGYEHADGSEVAVQVGGQNFTLFTQGDTAWTRSDADDRALSQAIRQGSAMVVRGTSSRGTRTKDTYSLAGSTAAYEAISEACGVK